MEFFSRIEVAREIKKLKRITRKLSCVLQYLINEQEFDSHEDAAANGVQVGQVFIASDTNTMGITPGALIARKEL